MPKIELKTVQNELEKGMIWPFYWLHGPERMKSRELLKRIRSTVFGKDSHSMNEEHFEGNEVDGSHILDSLISPSLYGGLKLVVVKDAHAMKNPEVLQEALGLPQARSELQSVCVCIAKDLDARKKFSKILMESAAVVPCEEVIESQKSSWIQFLAKRRELNLEASSLLQLCSLDPWSLDSVDQELEKLALNGISAESTRESGSAALSSSQVLESFFQRDLKTTLPMMSRLAKNTEEALPFLGLLAWNVRQWVILAADREQGTRHARPNPFLAEQFRKWGPHWKLAELIELQEALARIDSSMKQTPLMPLGLWTDLVIRFAH